MAYKEQPLTFISTNIITDQGEFVMMDWEDTLMAASAEYICSNGGDILEIGFGMGISANYIQSYAINSHTIIENHPDMIIKANAWAADKPNVTIIFKPWQEVINELPKFDGIFYDCWLDDQQPFDENVKNILNPEGIYSFFNNPINGEVNNIAIKSYNILCEFCDITSTSINIDYIDIKKHNYWDLDNKIYWIPECRLKT